MENVKEVLEEFPKMFTNIDFYTEEGIEKVSFDLAENYAIEFFWFWYMIIDIKKGLLVQLVRTAGLISFKQTIAHYNSVYACWLAVSDRKVAFKTIRRKI